MRLEDVREILKKFAQKVIVEAKNNLKRADIDTSGSLSNSLTFDFPEDEKSFILQFLGNYYGKFVDKGVRGAIKPRSGDEAAQEPYDQKKVYAFTNKMPPPSKLDKWIVRKGLAPRQKGKFTGRKIDTVGFEKSIQFLVARSIYSKGIKASLFFTKPFEKHLKKLEQDLFNEFDVSIENVFKK
tara:strand:- start:81 stop:629 length:549 start_codon:yes stop_codon:yes gene_type:complete